MGFAIATAYDREVLDLFTAIRHHIDLDHAGRLLALNSQRHLRTGAGDGCAVSRCAGRDREHGELSERLGFELSDLGYEFPRYPVPDGETMDSFLRKRVAEGSCAAMGRRMTGTAGAGEEAGGARTRSDCEAGVRGIFPDRVGHRASSASAMASWCKDGAARRIRQSAMRWRSRPSIRWAWNCCLNDF